ncbi:Hsp70 family protein [Solwaraspora sp. WMMD1047]|uniref:Hsp70 family protein n=1 Tax=Solwaraspora sp. WMMD1047 TaxID=3016102 RepID=UPI0024179D13|nr:Hsp70 family protein [Solwaraspora sp. WMMD1047]MDG4834188.1 Hsp70 family protein [Solwaraspora sp. WMMD1047]
MTAVGVVVWPDGRWVSLPGDGGPVCPGAVFVEPGGGLVAGSGVWQRAEVDPDRLVPAVVRLPDGPVTVADREVAAVDVVAAVLGQVAGDAARVAGGVVGDVRLVVPAGWGPRRRTWLRQAAHRAGLGQPRLVEAPVAVAEQVVAGGARLLVGDLVLVVDVGGGCEVTVLRRGPAGFEVLATLSDPDGGGDAVDEALIRDLTRGRQVDGRGRWSLLAGVRAAKEALTRQPAVVVPVGDGPPVAVTGEVVRRVSGAVLARVEELTGRVLGAAEVPGDGLAGVYCVGGAAVMPGVVQAVAAATGVSPVVLPQSGIVAATGAAGAYGPAGGQASPEPAPAPAAVRRAALWVVPGLMSIVLVTQFLLHGQGLASSAGYRGSGAYLLVNWGELAMAAVFALVACLSAGAFLGAALTAADTPGRAVAPGARVGSGIVAACAIGLGVAGLYAVTASLFFGWPIGRFLGWALLPSAAVAVVAVATAVVAVWWRRVPAAGWDAFLAFPMSSVLAAGAGMMLLQYAMTASRWPGLLVWIDASGRVGGLLIGVGVAAAVVRRPLHRLVAGVPLAVFGAAVVSWQATGPLGLVYAVAVAAWWGQRLWQLAVSPLREPTGAR